MSDENPNHPLDPKDEIGADLDTQVDPKPKVAKSVLGRIADDVWHEIVSEWMTNSVRNTPVAQTVEGWNGLQAALPALKKLLETRL